MRAVVQRVSQASVTVDGQVVGAIDQPGLLVLVGVTHEDTPDWPRRWPPSCGICASSTVRSRAPTSRRRSLVISQFTLYADTRKGRRPSWLAAAPGPVAEPLVDAVVSSLRHLGARVETGVFGADMKVSLINDGPFTLILEL